MLQQLESLNGMELSTTKQSVCRYNFRFLACHLYFIGQPVNYIWGVHSI